jgi:uncharacterized protein with PQ loop repeat
VVGVDTLVLFLILEEVLFSFSLFSMMIEGGVLKSPTIIILGLPLPLNLVVLFCKIQLINI